MDIWVLGQLGGGGGPAGLGPGVLPGIGRDLHCGLHVCSLHKDLVAPLTQQGAGP